MIRRVNRDDAGVLADLIRRGFVDVAKKFGLNRDNCPKHPSNYTEEWVIGDLERGVVYFIQEEDGIPVGCVGLENAGEGVFYVERLAVLPEHRRRGFGRRLMSHAESSAKVMGARRLEIGIISDDTTLRDWYLGAGFCETGRKRFPHLPFEVTFMAKEI